VHVVFIQYNGNLVKVDNENINRFLVNTLNSLTEWKNFGVWIGLQDQDSELQWQWVTNDPCNYICYLIANLRTFVLPLFNQYLDGKLTSMHKKASECI
jgi:hypothetical protein